jgi:hypothetical protein
MTKKWLLIIIILYALVALLFFVESAKAEEPVFLPIELSLQDWQKVVTGLEEHKICQEELDYVKQDNIALEKQNKLLKENMALSEGSLKLSEQRISNLEKELNLQDKACKEALKVAKPSIFQEIGKAALFILMGFGVALLL